MADGKLFRLVLVCVLVHAVAVWVASCAPAPRKMDWGAVAEAYEKSRKP